MALLAGKFDLLAHKAVEVERVWLDTFDWRLLAHRTRLEEIHEGRLVRTEWRENDTDALLGRIPGRAPKFAAAWPSSPQAERLAQTAKMRALLPVAKMRQTIRHAEVRDKRGKVVARLAFEKSEVIKPGRGKSVPLPQSVRVTFLKGFEHFADEIRHVFEVELRLHPCTSSYLQAIEATGHKPLSYTSKIGLKLDGNMKAEEALRSILSRLASIMEQNLAGTVADMDTEFLHDFRVAVRRTRSALGQLKDAVPPSVLARFRPAFGKIGEVTGPTRDLDVYLLKFDSYTHDLSTESIASLKPLRAHLSTRQKEEQAKLGKYLKSAEYREFFAKWMAVLGKPWKSPSKKWVGGQEVRFVANRRIMKIYKRILKQGAMLTEHSPAPAVHEMRIACKKLRYMIEFFRSIYPQEEVDPLVALLKELQDTLGDFQDHEVHRLELYGYAEEMAAKKQAAPRTLVAMGELAESLAERQRRARGEIEGKFASFGSSETKQKFRAVFGQKAERSDTDEGCRDVQH